MTDVSIALLTKNAGPLLDRVLAGIAIQQTLRTVERIAVDSGSTDGTLARLRNANFAVMPFHDKPFDFGRAREFAFANAPGEFVVNLSQDAVPADASWLENLLRPFEDERVAASCGRSVPDPERGFPPFPWELNGRFYFTREIRKFTAQYGRGLSFANSAIRRSVWEQLHFDPIALGEDFQFQQKLSEAGLPIAFVDDAPVFHHHNYDLPNLFARCRNEGAALGQLGVPYGVLDLLADLARPDMWIQAVREVSSGRANSAAAVCFPVVRPAAVFIGNRRRGGLVDYRPETQPDA